MLRSIKTDAKVSVTRKVKKVKLTKSETLDITFEEFVNIYETIDGDEKVKSITSENTRIGKNIVHEDMKNALRFLRAHLAILCDQVEAQKTTFHELDDNEEALDRYKVTSYSIGGEDIHEGVTLSGSRRGFGGMPLNLNSPFTKFEGTDNEDTYEYSFELRGIINHCNEEALSYIEGKMAPDAQLNIFDQEPEEEDTEGEAFE
ncbi:hypothetical protein [Sphingobacterium kyonggiense]